MAALSLVKVLAFAGSLRRDSYNKKVVNIAADGARETGAHVTVIDLKDYPLPIFDEDLETNSGLPAEGRKLKDLFMAHHGLIIASPEYNSSISAALKNVIDWVSRPCIGPDGKPEAPLAGFNGKVAGLVAASPGALGGLRGLVECRRILGNLNVLVLPHQVAVNKAHEAFNAAGDLNDEKQKAMVRKVGAEVARTCARLID